MLPKFIKITTTTILLSLSLGTASQASSFEVLINDGLNSPRKLIFGPDQQLYFTEAGTGSSTGNCLLIRGEEYCYGENSTVKRWNNGVVENILTDLPSFALSSNGRDASGAQDLAFDENGNPFVVLGWGGGNQRSSNSVFASLGTLIQLDNLNIGTGWNIVADLVDFEETNNPDGLDGNAINSNPFALTFDGNQVIIVDAGANDVLRGTPNQGHYDLTLETVFPNRLVQNPFAPPGTLIPMEAVPTAVTIGPDGAYYVGQLTGFPFPVGGANIYRIDPITQAVTIWATGFTTIIDLEFDNNNNLFVLEYTTNSLLSNEPAGSLIKIFPNGRRQILLDEEDGLIFPTGLAVGQDGYVYLANNGDEAGQGQLIRTSASVPEPSLLLGLLTFGVVSIVKRHLT